MSIPFLFTSCEKFHFCSVFIFFFFSNKISLFIFTSCVKFYLSYFFSDKFSLFILLKNRTYCFYDGMINVKIFDPNLLTLDKKTSKDIAICYIEYVTKKDEYKFNIVNPLFTCSYNR